MKLEQVKTSDLKTYDLNAKLHPQLQIEGLANSIKTFGWTQPIVVDNENNIVIGHGRYLAALFLKLDVVPCQRMEKLNPDQIRALRLLDNRISETGYDIEKLNFDLDGFQFDFSQFNIDFSNLNFDLQNPVKDKGSKELNASDFDNLKHTCPRCSFEFE